MDLKHCLHWLHLEPTHRDVRVIIAGRVEVVQDGITLVAVSQLLQSGSGNIEITSPIPPHEALVDGITVSESK
jgi:hypothetical protein